MSNKNLNKKRKSRDYWILIISLWTILLSGGFSLFSDTLLRRVNILVAFIILILVIFIGVIFDIMGVAVTSANVTPFNAMAAKKVSGAKIAINLVKNAAKVSSFCNDVVGDICGIVSGSIGALVAVKFINLFSQINPSYITVIIGIMISILTIVGKALGKEIAMSRSTEITYFAAKVINFIKRGR